MSTVIQIDNLSKIYDLGLVGTGTLSKDLNRTWAKLTGKPDPYAKIAELNDRTKKSQSNTVYALKNINFSVEQGEILGIIGRNGAGKSTLLKILSEITSPSSGSIKIKGRIASLLEVGTGMHPEMTARQNIYLNGSLMGMRRYEIKNKLDEIIAFAGIEKYVDTPVKRFSSGMNVRLGFAVAAFLEPEILVVDEVLAVGDAEFQKKAIGKMQDISKGEGRTILFVSHNMASIRHLCNSGIVLNNGEISYQGSINSAVNEYLSINTEQDNIPIIKRTDRTGNGNIIVSDVTLKNVNNEIIDTVFCGEYLKIEISLNKKRDVDFSTMIVACSLTDIYQNNIASWVSDEMESNFHSSMQNSFFLEIPNINLRPNTYFLFIQISFGSTQSDDIADSIYNTKKITILSSNFFSENKKIRSSYSALIKANFKTK